MTIYIYGKVQTNLRDKELIKQLFYNIQQYFDTIVVWQDFFYAISDILDSFKGIITFNTQQDLINLIAKQENNILLSLGGDGTMLDTVDYVIGTNIAVLGINLGHLGFLTSAGREDLNTIVKEIVMQNFTIEQRPILLADNSKYSTNRKFAVNEVCFLSTNRGSIIDLEVYNNDRYVSTFSGDGLLIATPTGSTAYSLSAGGPIITPQSRCLCLTPIAPHNLTFRPIIMNDNDVIKVKIPKSDNHCKVLLDGYTIIEKSDIEITVHKANFDWNLVRLKDKDFFCSIREKLMWGQTPVYLTGNM